jgi:hypothetical protein
MTNVPYVHVPKDDTDISVEQFASAASRLATDLWVLKCRFEGGYGEMRKNDWQGSLRNPNALDDREKDLYERACSVLKELGESVLTPAMVKLAKTVPDAEPPVDPDSVTWSPAVDKIVHNGDVDRFITQQPTHEGVRLAIAILEALGFEHHTESVLGLLSGEYSLGSRWGGTRINDIPAHLCSRCEGEGCLGGETWARDTCKRCKGWGYVLQAEADDAELDLTREGKIALNNGETWTAEQEAVASGYESLADAKTDGFDLPIFFDQKTA